MLDSKPSCASCVVLTQSKFLLSSCLVKIQNNILIIGEKKSKAKSNSEMITLDKPSQQGPDLPFKITHQCMVKVDDRNIYIIGGIQNSSTSNKTWLMDPTKNYELKEGPPLNGHLYDSSCALMKIKGKAYIVVVGSTFSDMPNPQNPQSSKTVEQFMVEILDTSSHYQGWIKGMYKF